MGPDSQGSQYGSSEFQNQRYYRSPVSPGVDEFGSSDHFDELPTYGGPRSIRYEGAVNGGRGHTRNGSLDDNTMLKQLRSGGKYKYLSGRIGPSVHIGSTGVFHIVAIFILCCRYFRHFSRLLSVIQEYLTQSIF